MANYTKLDRLRENQAAAAERRKNISELSADLSEAVEIYTIMPRGSMQAEADRRELSRHIDIIRELLADERRALSELMGGAMDGNDPEAVAARAVEIIPELNNL